MAYTERPRIRSQYAGNSVLREIDELFFGLQLVQEPCLGEAQIAADRRYGNAENSGGFLGVHAGKVMQFHRMRRGGIFFSEFRERIVDFFEIDAAHGAQFLFGVDLRFANRSTAALLCEPRFCMVHQNMTHELRGDAVKMRAVGERYITTTET